MTFTVDKNYEVTVFFEVINKMEMKVATIEFTVHDLELYRKNGILKSAVDLIKDCYGKENVRVMKINF